MPAADSPLLGMITSTTVSASYSLFGLHTAAPPEAGASLLVAIAASAASVRIPLSSSLKLARTLSKVASLAGARFSAN